MEMLNGLPDVVAIYDRSWRFTFLNTGGRATLEAMGRDPDDAVGQVVWELLPELVGTRFETETKRAALEGRIVEYEEWQADLQMWFENRIIPMGDRVVAISRNITVRKRAQQAVMEGEAQFQSMVDAIANLAWIANGDGWIFWYNRRWYEYTGKTPAEMEGWGWQSVHDPDMLSSVLERWTASIRTGEPFDMEFPLRGADGSFRPFLTRVMPLRGADDSVVRWVGTNTDVSEQRAAVADRERMLVAERAARAAVEESNRVKAQFLATMSHELRTPLNAIAGYADLMDAGVAGPLNAQQQQYVQRVRRSQQHLLALINDILNFAKLEAGHVHYDLHLLGAQEQIERLAAIVDVQASASGIAFTIHADNEITVYADSEKLQQILINLCSNGIKAMPDGGELSIRCYRDAEQTVFEVRDTGNGIPKSKLDSIFEPFVQLDRSLTSPKEGTGLGLAISRDLARAMNGSLVGESELGEGARFVLRLPAHLKVV